jgi:excinuclease UvrABC ATPase subunit
LAATSPSCSTCLDEPTPRLHLADLEQLLGVLNRLVDSGKSVIVIEHHQTHRWVISKLGWIVDAGHRLGTAQSLLPKPAGAIIFPTAHAVRAGA